MASLLGVSWHTRTIGGRIHLSRRCRDRERPPRELQGQTCPAPRLVAFRPRAAGCRRRHRQLGVGAPRGHDQASRGRGLSLPLLLWARPLLPLRRPALGHRLRARRLDPLEVACREGPHPCPSGKARGRPASSFRGPEYRSQVRHRKPLERACPTGTCASRRQRRPLRGLLRRARPLLGRRHRRRLHHQRRHHLPQAP